MTATTVFVLMATCICIVNDFELRNLSTGIKAFYELADNDLQTDDFLEIMEYLDQRFHRKCFSVEHNIKTYIRTNDVVDIMGNMKAEIEKLSLDIVEDRERFQNGISNMETALQKLSTDIVDDQTRFQNEISDIKENFVVFQNEHKDSEAKAEKEFMRSNLLCNTEEYVKCLAGECCIATEVSYRNLALGKQAWQSSTWSNVQRAEIAVDGDRATLSHTLLETTPLWMVDLGNEWPVARVIIVNRADGSWARLRNIVVTVSSSREQDGEVCGGFDGPGTQGQVIEITCVKKLHGRYVKLTMNSRNYLHVGEVEVYSQ